LVFVVVDVQLPTRVPSKGENDPWIELPGAAVTSVASRSIMARSTD
jgi:hypothetical protein